MLPTSHVRPTLEVGDRVRYRDAFDATIRFVGITTWYVLPARRRRRSSPHDVTGRAWPCSLSRGCAQVPLKRTRVVRH